MEPAWDSLSPSLCAPPLLALSLFQSREINLKKKKVQFEFKLCFMQILSLSAPEKKLIKEGFPEEEVPELPKWQSQM